MLMKYCQCQLCKITGMYSLVRVSYIPQKFAIKGDVVKLKEDDESWSDGWKIMSVGEAVDERHLPDSHSEIKAHRKATGDSLPK